MAKIKKRKNIFFLVVFLMIIFTVMGFGAGFFFFAPKLTGKRLGLQVSVHGIRVLSPNEVVDAKDAEFSDVWKRGVSEKDIPTLNRRRDAAESNGTKSSKRSSSNTSTTKQKADTKTNYVKTDDSSDFVDVPVNTTPPSAPSTSSTKTTAKPSNETVTPSPNDANYTTNSRKRDE